MAQVRSEQEDRILRELNPTQREAVTFEQGPLLILAGAGSGKTRVLVHRLAYLIKYRGISPWNILAVTFTNKAADEMKQRAERLLGYSVQNLWVRTFHSACVRILRYEAERIGFPRDFAIYDASDQLTLIRECLRELNYDEKRFYPRAVLSYISQAKSELFGVQEFTEAKSDNFFEGIVAKVYALYQDKLWQSSAMDFDDLIMMTVKLWRDNPDVLDYYQEKFRYILIDEYQDTNHAQYVLVKLLAEKYRNLCVVGDPDQSIYAFRGADIRNILDFEKDYPEAKVIRLEQNYRSTKNILAAASEVVKNNINRKEKTLWTENEEGDLTLYAQLSNGMEEATFISEQIEDLYLKGDRRYNDFVTLYRTNAQSRTFEEVFSRRGLPYRIVGSLGFYERKEIKDIIAYLRIIANTSNSVSLKRIINVPSRHIGEVTIRGLEDFTSRQGKPLYEALRYLDDIEEIRPMQRRALKRFREMIEEFRRCKDTLNINQLLSMILDKTGYISMLEEEGTVQAETRIENLKELLTVTQEFAAESEGDLDSFLERVSLTSNVERVQGEELEDAVTLMTLHCAKGLEFPVVFITGMEEGLFPHSRSLSNENELEEERRLCYVGMTRAKKKLYLTSAFHRLSFGNTIFNAKSRFLSEIPEHLLGDLLAQGEETTEDEEEFSGIIYKAGDKVRHPSWGIGTIVSRSGYGDNAEVKVIFSQGNLKRLLLKYAPLEKVD